METESIERKTARKCRLTRAAEAGHYTPMLVAPDFSAMKRSIALNLKLKVLLGIVSLVLTGCGHTIRLKVVDAATKEPLAGVSTLFRQDYDGYFHLKHEGPTNLPPSGHDGVIAVSGLHRNWYGRFIFSCPGRSNFFGLYSVGSLGLADRIRYMPPGPFEGQFILEGTLTSASRSNGCFLIPMK
jgi:hypothetical protein